MAARKPDDESLRAITRFMMITIGLCFLMASAVALPDLFMRQSEIITIIKVDAARECRSRRTFKIWPKHRSSMPEVPITYCGLIMSDHGSFELPETTWLNIFGAPRAALYDQLMVGCSYRVVVAGPGLELEKNRLMSNRNKTLKSAKPLDSCAAFE
jgi:hypothetical protein